ncbi:MAG: TetR family transcriptional regulator [Betaproteobacteria bacterium]|jgi:TetR/AcrR family transcriptional repressor of nem operon|nr:TetR family transcriptional regulator [Betaproteobacteria bacterium]
MNTSVHEPEPSFPSRRGVNKPLPVKNPKSKDRSAERSSKRQDLVRYGTELLTEQGYQATGIDQVLKKVGVPKGSFYHFFKSKDEFGSAVIENYVDFYAKKMDKIFNTPSTEPLQRLKNFVEKAKYDMVRFEFRRGCLIGNMGQELASINDGFRVQLEEVLVSWEIKVTACLQEAIDRLDISGQTDAAALSRFFWIGWEGAILRSKLTKSVQPIDHFADLFFSKVAK